MAQAMKRIYGDKAVKLGIGPVIADGIYYDIDIEKPLAVIIIYTQGEFSDLCRGPHLPSTGRIKALKLMNVAGAYGRGDSKNKMLQRIYGTSFSKKGQLDEHMKLLEEAKKRDHRKLGKALGLFMLSEEAPGMPFLLVKRDGHPDRA